MTEIDDRRRHPRFDVHDLSGVLDGFRVFEALKLSAGGMLIRLPAELAMDQVVRVELPLGDEVFHSLATVVFLGPDLGDSNATGESFRIGLEFASPAPANEAVLRRYIGTALAPGSAPHGR